MGRGAVPQRKDEMFIITKLTFTHTKAGFDDAIDSMEEGEIVHMADAETRVIVLQGDMQSVLMDLFVDLWEETPLIEVIKI